MGKRQALVVLSGGQDSTTCLFWAIKNYGDQNISAIGFSYAQRHRNELDYASEICLESEISYDVINLPFLSEITSNALTDSSTEIDDSNYKGKYPNTFVDGRNLLFLSYAAIYAKQRNIKDIITGVGQADFSGYPDCRDIFIKSLNVTLNLSMDFEFNIMTPLMHKNKSEIWEMSDDLGCIDIIKYRTLTCYNGIVGEGCGKCPACVLRKKGFDEYTNNLTT